MRSKQKHTSGPWVARCVIDNHWVIAAASSNIPGTTQTVAELNGPWSAKNYEGNARLVAAAPELLEALEGLAFSPDLSDEHELSPYTCSALDRAKAAIAKARGK
jgi:hypothetical protein